MNASQAATCGSSSVMVCAGSPFASRTSQQRSTRFTSSGSAQADLTRALRAVAATANRPKVGGSRRASVASVASMRATGTVTGGVFGALRHLGVDRPVSARPRRRACDRGRPGRGSDGEWCARRRRARSWPAPTARSPARCTPGADARQSPSRGGRSSLHRARLRACARMGPDRCRADRNSSTSTAARSYPPTRTFRTACGDGFACHCAMASLTWALVHAARSSAPSRWPSTTIGNHARRWDRSALVASLPLICRKNVGASPSSVRPANRCARAGSSPNARTSASMSARVTVTQARTRARRVPMSNRRRCGGNP